MTDQGPANRPVALGDDTPPEEPSDEIEGEVLDPDEAERLSEQAAAGTD